MSMIRWDGNPCEYDGPDVTIVMMIRSDRNHCKHDKSTSEHREVVTGKMKCVWVSVQSGLLDFM